MTNALAAGCICLALFGVAGDEPAKSFATPDGPPAKALSLLAVAAEMPAGPGESASASRARLSDVVEQAITLVQAESPVGEALSAALSQSQQASADADAVDSLNQAIAVARSSLEFSPVAEADLPQDFPTYTPAGSIEVKKYPAYRRAVAGGFWTLFRHIQSNGIAMTAPVEMRLSDDGGRVRQDSMAFLYGAPSLGVVGKQGPVEVVDEPPQTVAALGVRGAQDDKSLADARTRLERWLANHTERRAAGAVRVMGYNSPFVPRGDQFFEVQVPLEADDN